MLDEARLDELQKQYGKVGVVDFNGHQLVFKKPMRDIAREYRRMRDVDAEKAGAMDFLAQATIIAYDGETDANKARTLFTGVFLEEYPLATLQARFGNVLLGLAGLLADEEAADLGKGARIKGLRPPDLPKV